MNNNSPSSLAQSEFMPNFGLQDHMPTPQEALYLPNFTEDDRKPSVPEEDMDDFLPDFGITSPTNQDEEFLPIFEDVPIPTSEPYIT